jgi:general secretion pathway protein J
MTEPADIASGDSQSGVTLLEVLVALAVVALAMAIAGSGLRLLGRSGDRGAAVIARHETLSRGIGVLRRDIERLERAVRKRGDNAEFVFRGDQGRLTFVVVEPPFPAEAGPHLVVYSIAQQGDDVLLTRERAPFEASTAELEGPPMRDSVAVIEGRYRLRFVYLGRNVGGGRWLSQWSDPYSLPDLIGLEVSDLDARSGAVMPPIVFRPRLDAERSCAKDEGGGSCTIGKRGSLASDSAARSEGRN